MSDRHTLIGSDNGVICIGPCFGFFRINESESKGTKGMARLVGFQEKSTSNGSWEDGQPRPVSFEQNIKRVLKNINIRADFDWDKGKVKSVYDDGESTLDLVPGTLDATSAGLAIRAGLLRGEIEWRFPVVDKNSIDNDRFRSAEPVSLDTALGCLEVRTVAKIRGPQSSRYTRTSHATELDFVPVFVEHGKQGGNHLETRIKTLILDGKTVKPRAGC